jgi:hypothetical protein
LLSSILHFTTDSEEKDHGYTRQEVSYEVWRQHRKKARRRKIPRRREGSEDGEESCGEARPGS